MTSKRYELNCETCSGRGKSIFCDLQGENLKKLDTEKNSNLYKRGQDLFLSGNPPFGLYCVHSGKVKLTKIDNDGKETIVRIAGAGDVLGHRSLFSGSPYTASATVMEDGLICFVSKETIKSLITKEPQLSFNIIGRISKEMGAAENKLASMARKSVRERFAETLLLLKENFSVIEDNKIKLDIRLTREELASMVGAASENIIRLMTEYKESGYIEQNGKVIYILDLESIEQEANLSY